MIARNSGAVSTFKGDGIWSREYMRVESGMVHADLCEKSTVEHYTRPGEETLSHHPSKRNSRERVAGLVFDGTTTDVYTRKE